MACQGCCPFPAAATGWPGNVIECEGCCDCVAATKWRQEQEGGKVMSVRAAVIVQRQQSGNF